MSLKTFFFGTSGYQTEEEAAANLSRQQEILRAQSPNNERFIETVGPILSVGGAYGEGFNEGLNEGRENIDGFVFGSLKKIFGAVPWFIWLGVAIAIFGWLGGFAMIARQSKGALNR